MLDISQYIISPDRSVLEAMSVIDTGARGIVFVCGDDGVLGTITDGDIRRYILKGGDLSVSVITVANKNFQYLNEFDAIDSNTLDKIKSDFKALPVLDSKRNIKSIIFSDDVLSVSQGNLHAQVVIMAGGKGTRLYPYTKVLPKPLIPIGDIPITMHIMQYFEKFGCVDFTMVINHQKELIKAYYSDSEIPYSIGFVEETVPLGTAGGLKFLENKIQDTFFLTNCDILVDTDYQKIYEYHKSRGNLVTMVCAVKKITIPYGTVTLSDTGVIKDMIEKPTISYLVNTGFYVVEPEFISKVPEDTFIHMPELIQECMDEGKRIGVYPISEMHWSDMGQIDEMQKMRSKVVGEFDG